MMDHKQLKQQARQAPELTPEQKAAQEQYNKEFDEFAKNFLQLNSWGQVEFAFTLRSQLNFLMSKVAELEKKVAPDQKKHLTLVPKA